MKQPYLLQTSPDTLILFDNGKDNFFAGFHQAFSGCEVESEHENIFALFGTDAFFTVRGGQNDNAGLSQALFDFAAQNGWGPYDCLALCICLFNEQEQERMKREFEV